MATRHWLIKSEPSVYSIEDLERDGKTEWSGVRNYKARSYMRDEMQVGDGLLFYHSNTDPLGVYGVVIAVPVPRARAAVASGAWETAGLALTQVRRLVGVNLVLGLVTLTVAILGHAV